jgi:hypothetical protein
LAKRIQKDKEELMILEQIAPIFDIKEVREWEKSFMNVWFIRLLEDILIKGIITINLTL